MVEKYHNNYNKKLILLITIILVVVAILYVEFGMKGTGRLFTNTELVEIEKQNMQKNVGLGVGNKAPNFILHSLDKSIDGKAALDKKKSKKITLWSFAGNKAVILNFWATWCVPCKEEMPLLQKYYDANKGNLEILAINLQENEQIVNDWTRDFKLTFPILLDPTGFAKRLYAVNAQPATFFIDKAGIIRAKRVGQLTEDEIPGHLRKILSEDEREKSKDNREINISADEIKYTSSGIKYIVDPKKLLSGGPPKDGIPSIDKPKYISAKEADKFLNEKELVMGINYKNVARAYPLQIMVWHEIVNDKINDEPVLITYCPLCGTGIAFERKIDTNNDGIKETVEFGVSGKLYNSDLVMYDRATDTFWQQVTGKAIIGKLVGERLKLLPIDTVAWQDWKKLHPDTEVLSKDTGHFRSYGSSPYGDYDTNEEVYFPVDNVDNRLHPKTIIYGFEKDGKFKAYPDDELKKAIEKATKAGKNFIEDTFAGINVKIERTNEGIVSAVNADTGEEVGLIRSFWFAWIAFNPKTELYNAE
ncbi:DUF3179 domain-containing protein [Candidatus Woesearchaeota archaeon]|nr:DUF3179 domain-containing protein [Candidatus Woesearchaeota archaeon]